MFKRRNVDMSGKLSSQPSELETLLTNHVGQVWKASGFAECVAIQHLTLVLVQTPFTKFSKSAVWRYLYHCCSYFPECFEILLNGPYIIRDFCIRRFTMTVAFDQKPENKVLNVLLCRRGFFGLLKLLDKNKPFALNIPNTF